MSAENLYLHYVSDGPPRRRQTISRADLRNLITSRRSAGRRSASLEAYRSGAPDPDAFTLSFDDAHASVLAHAAPVLAELDMPATLFVPTSARRTPSSTGTTCGGSATSAGPSAHTPTPTRA